MRRKGYAEIEHMQAEKYRKHRRFIRRCEAAIILIVFGTVATVFYYALWMWANGYIGG